MNKEDFLKEKDIKLREILSKIPEFKNKGQLIYHYVAYEFPNKQQYLIEFWEKTFNLIMKNYFKKISIKKKELKEVFIFDKLAPAAFDDILNILINKGDIIKAKDFDTTELFSRLGYPITKEIKLEKKSIIKKVSDIISPFKIFSGKTKQETIKNDEEIIFYHELKHNIANVMESLPLIFNHALIQKETEVDEYLIKKLNLNQDDLAYYKIFFLKTKILQEDSFQLAGKTIKCLIYNDKNREILAEKTCFKVKATIEYFETRIKHFEEEADLAHKEAYMTYKKKNVEQAKRLLRKEKMLKEKYHELAFKKETLEYQLLSIESASSSRDLVTILQQVNATQNEFKLNQDEIYDLKEEIKNTDKDNKEIAQMLSAETNQDKMEIEEEMKRLELEIMDIPINKASPLKDNPQIQIKSDNISNVNEILKDKINEISKDDEVAAQLKALMDQKRYN